MSMPMQCPSQYVCYNQTYVAATRTYGAAFAISTSFSPFIAVRHPFHMSPSRLEYPSVPGHIIQVPVGWTQVRLQGTMFNGQQDVVPLVCSRSPGVVSLFASDADPVMFGAVMLEVLPLTNVVVTVKSERELREIIYLGVLHLIAVLEIVFHLLKSCKFCNKKRGDRKEHEQLLFSESEQVASSVLSLKTVLEDTKNQ